jgi:hypothetical protein
VAATTRQIQRAMNRFTKAHLYDVGVLRVDGDKGPATRKRIRLCKFHLGYTEKRQTATTGLEFRNRLRDPRDPRAVRFGNAKQRRRAVARGIKRRTEQRARARLSRQRAKRTTGTANWNGKIVAAWFVPYLDYAKQHGWQGWVTSGYRSPAYSEYLCKVMCGRPSCPGRCAGRATNHAHSTKPGGAIDVASYAEFGRIMRSCPYSPRLVNHLPIDPVHYSASGR